MQHLYTTLAATSHPSLIDFDHDIGLPIPRPTKDIYDQAILSVQQRPKVTHQPLLLNPQLRIATNSFYFSSDALCTTQIFPTRGYPWTILPHPTTAHIALRRVYTRDLV